MKIYQVNDKFLRDFLGTIPYQELEVLNKALRCDFRKTFNKGETKPLTDYENKYQLYHNIINLINKNLFDVSDNKGFPKARLFVEKYILNREKHTNKNDIVRYYIQEELLFRLFSNVT